MSEKREVSIQLSMVVYEKSMISVCTQVRANPSGCRFRAQVCIKHDEFGINNDDVCIFKCRFCAQHGDLSPRFEA